MNTNKLKYIFILLLALFATNNVQAADFRFANKDNSNINVGLNEIFKNFYSAGNIVSIDANIQKNLYVAGNVVTVNGAVGETIYAGAGTTIINGRVDGSVHVGGGSIIINNAVSDDLFIGGGTVSISKSASVGNDLFVGAGTVDINGPVYGNAKISGGMININSEIRGDVKIYSADKIKLGSSAKIFGNLEYNSKNIIEIESGAVVLGKTISENKNATSTNKIDKDLIMSIVFAVISVTLFVKLVGLVILALVLIHFFKDLTEKIAEEGLTNFWQNLGIGLVSMIVAPIIIIISLITLVGIWLGIFLGLLYILSLFIAITFSGVIFGKWLFEFIKKTKNHPIDWKVIVCGFVVLGLVRFIPIIGWLISAMFITVSLGAVYQHVYHHRKNNK